MKTLLLILIVLTSFIVGCNLVSGTKAANTAGSSGSVPNPTPTPPTLSTSVAPGGNFDLTIWQLQLPIGPTGSPTTITSSQLVGASGYSSAYFYTDSTDGAMVFMDTQTGTTTSGSSHPRTELREMTAGGSAAAWAPSGSHVMTVMGAISQLGGGSSGNTAIGQLFDSTSGKPMLEVQANGDGNIKLLLEDTRAGGSSHTYNLGTWSAGVKYNYSVSLSGTTLTVTVNGTAQTFTPDASFFSTSTNDMFYFKCGNYDQKATSGATSTTPYTVVKVYALSVVHS